MAQADARSLEEIKRDTERARAGLTETVGALKSSVNETANDIRERIAPEAIKAEVNSYIKSRGEALLDSITDAAQKNPLQAIAVGASIAFPLLRVVRAIPAPVLMVGAGLYLAGTKRGQEVTRQATDAATELAGDVSRRARELRHDVEQAAAQGVEYATSGIEAVTGAVASGTAQIKDTANAIGASVTDRVDSLRRQASDTGENLRRQVSATGEAIAGRAGELSERAGDAAQSGAAMTDEARSALRHTAHDVADSGRQALHATADAGRDALAMGKDALQSGKEALNTARHRAAELGSTAGKGFVDTVTKNPMLVAGIGLLVGGLIASALPRSRIEDRTVGGASANLKKRARDTVDQGIDAAKETASAVVDSVSGSAEREGLTGDGLSDTAKDLGERVRKVAEAGMSAMDAPSHNKH
jgi:hypothetical protein